MPAVKYFENLPKIVYTRNGNSILYTNLLARASVRPSILRNSLIYYEYDIQDSDTPEIIAAKYYNDVYRFWMVLLPNNILDPQWDWPMESIVFQNYLTKKYPGENTKNLLHHYEKTLTQKDLTSGKVTVFTVVIDEDTWDNTVEQTQIIQVAGNQVEVKTTKKSVSVYDYEDFINAKKRKIRLINSSYAGQLEDEISELMR
jgi:hypothetical protein